MLVQRMESPRLPFKSYSGVVGKSQTEKKNTCFVDRLHRLTRSEHYTLLSYQIPQLKLIFGNIFPVLKTIVDCTAHIGGDCINFSQMYPEASIIAIEKNQDAFRCLQKNVREFTTDPSKFFLVYESCVSYVKRILPVSDLFYIDPPWGEIYYKRKPINLYLDGKDVTMYIEFILSNNLTQNVLLKVPRNYNFTNLESLGYIYDKYIIKKDRGRISYILVHIKQKKIMLEVINEPFTHSS